MPGPARCPHPSRAILQILAVTATLAAPVASEPLYHAADDAAGAPAVALRSALSVEAIRLEPRLLQSATPSLTVELDGRPVELVARGFESRADSSLWVGAVRDESESFAVLSTRRGVAAGLILSAGRAWQILPSGSDYLLAEIDQEDALPCGMADHVDATDHQALPSFTGAATVPAGGGSHSPAAAAIAEQVIDLLIVYSHEARDAAGGGAAIEAVIQNAVDLTNTALANSEVRARVRLAGVSGLDYHEAGDAEADLARISQDPEVARLRAAAGADLVSLFVADGGRWCGFGWYFSGRAADGFNVTNWQCAVGQLIFPHEVGHNLGADHNPENAVRPPPAHDHYVPGSFRTVMTYAAACGGPCAVVPYFSNPAVSYNGHPTGITGQRNNASILGANAAAVAAFTEAAASASGSCQASDTALCLNRGRFEVAATWRSATGDSGAGRAQRLTADSGYFWFFDPNNVEVTVKLLDACTLPGFESFWFFAAGMTNVEITLTVRDTASGQVRTYRNPLGATFRTVEDTGAFHTCT